MENVIKIQIAISLFSGAVLALSVFFGTIAGNTLLKDRNLGSKLFFLFIFLMSTIIVLSLIVLFNPHTADLSFWRKIIGIK